MGAQGGIVGVCVCVCVCVGLGLQMRVLKEGAMTFLSDFFSLEFSSRFRFWVWFLVCRV